MHEAQLHSECCFLTLTYNRDNLPTWSTLVPEHLQLFLKRFRRAIAPTRISFLASGEYGGQLGRPHYHAIIFGYDFRDKKFLKDGTGGLGRLYTSELLEKLWGHGYCTTGELSFESASYVARYSLKKVTGTEAPGWYTRLDPETGELVDIEQEFLRMSRRPAIAKNWFNKYGQEVFPHDEVIVRGHQQKPPRYYLKLQQQLEVGPCAPGDTPISARVKAERRRTISSRAARIERGPERLRVKEKVKLAQLQSLKRNLDP